MHRRAFAKMSANNSCVQTNKDMTEPFVQDARSGRHRNDSAEINGNDNALIPDSY